MPKVVDTEQRRSELADAAARVIAREGIDGASLRTVAAEAGWTTGALVPYFSTKRELLAFTLRASLERRRVRRAERASLAPADALLDTLIGSLPTTADKRMHWTVTLAFAAQAGADTDLAEIQRTAYLEVLDAVVDLVEAGGRADAESAPAEAERLLAVVNGVALQALFAPERWPRARQIAAVEAALTASPSVDLSGIGATS